MADATDWLAGDPNFGLRHSLDNGSHSELLMRWPAFSVRVAMDLAGIFSNKKARNRFFIGVIYLVTKKITVDNVAEGRGKPPAVVVGTICNLWGSGT